MFTKAALISLLVACVRAGALENALRASVELKLTQVSVDQMTAAPGLVAEIYADKLGTPRTIVFDDAGDLLVLAKQSGGRGQIVSLYPNEFFNATAQTVLYNGPLNLNHGLVIRSPFVYASSDTAVYRWNYTAGQRAVLGSDPQLVIEGIPGGGNHVTRTLVFDPTGRLFVSVGSASNVDKNSIRARVHVFDIPSNVSLLPLNWEAGDLWADGLRNEVAMATDANGVLWGVENGADNLKHPVFGDITEQNPAEEFNRLDAPGAFYGYPSCFSEYNIDHPERGGFLAQHAWPNGVTDSFCRDPKNNRPPTYALQGHTAPLGMIFYNGQGCVGNTRNSSFPDGVFPTLSCANRTGDALVALHGSWNRKVPDGYRLVRVHFENGTPVSDEWLAWATRTGSCGKGGYSCLRPVHPAVDAAGTIFFSSSTGSVIRLRRAALSDEVGPISQLPSRGKFSPGFVATQSGATSAAPALSAVAVLAMAAAILA